MPNLAIVASAPVDVLYAAWRWWSNEDSPVFVLSELMKLGFYWKHYGVLPVG
jgi:hypothetical protein